ncbi:MAG: hypothetical protein QOC99_3851 [Acidobacteriota bacterium]|jgi:hypothetical protein|nr:hypothetical protein [Acidobacteriota bacterium]
MQFDWQTIAVALIIAFAGFYVARRGFARLRSFSTKKKGGGASCATGCGNCGDVDAPLRQTNVIVPLGSTKGAGRRRG